MRRRALLSLRPLLAFAALAVLSVLSGWADATVARAGPEGGGVAPGDPDAAARARLLAYLSHERRLDLAFLEHLGWRVLAGRPGTGIVVQGGWPARRPTLAAAQAAGDLEIRVAPDVRGDAVGRFAPRLGPLADSRPSRSAFKHREAVAVRDATRKLADNTERGRFTFPKLVLIDSPWFRVEPPEPEWRREGTMAYARGSPARAIAAFYDREAVAECYAAQWIALFATQYEVLGPRAFDEAYRPDELVLGRPNDIVDTPFGHYVTDVNPSPWRALLIAPPDYDLDPGVALARQGPVAFAAASGVVENVEPGLRSNDNFVIVSVTPEATAWLLENDGFAGVTARTEAAWEAHERGRRGVVKGASGTEARDEVEAILSETPFLGITLYVHPYGVVPLKEIVQHRVGTIQRPVRVRVYRNSVEDAFYQRYRAWFRAHAEVAEPPR